MKKFKIGDIVMLKSGKHLTNYNGYTINKPFIISKEWSIEDTGGGWCYMEKGNTQGVFQNDLISGKITNWKARIQNDGSSSGTEVQGQ